jgi:multiple sugar transport system permease protein
MTTNNIKKIKKKDVNNTGYLFVIPFIVVFLIFSIYPVLRTLMLSFTNFKGYGSYDFVMFDNYVRVFNDKFFWKAFGNTCYIWGINIVLQLGIALILTIIFSDMKYRIKGLGFFRAVFYLPNLIAMTSVSFLFKTLLDWRYGTFNQLLMNLGLTDHAINWLGQTNTAPVVVAILGAWMWFGNSFIVLMAGVQGIPTTYFEAAKIDGASRFVIFKNITIPLLKPILVYVSITSLIGGLQIFDIPFLISGGTSGDPSGALQTAVMYLYKFGFEADQVGYASAIAYTLFLIILSISLVQLYLVRDKDKGGK